MGLRRCFRPPRLLKTSCIFSILFFTVLHIIMKQNDMDSENKNNHNKRGSSNSASNKDHALDNVSAHNDTLFERGRAFSEAAAHDTGNKVKPESKGHGGGHVAQTGSRGSAHARNEQRKQRKEYTEEEIRSIFDRLVIDRPSDPNAPGGRGEAMQVDVENLSLKDAKEYYKGWELHGFNLFASDRISLQRETPPDPETQCADITFLPELPDTSVIIIFYNEALSTLLRTVYSVINTTPPHLLKEIILVDDFSDYDEVQAPLEWYIAHHLRAKVLLRRTASRHGLIQARLYGIQFVTGETITFLDAHCECVQGWIEPLLDQVARNATTVAMPVIDQIHYETFQHNVYSGATAAVGTFTWMLNFDWLYTSNAEYRRKATPLSATRSATMAGGLFTIHRDFFRRLGYYDPELRLYGAENLELSFKIWMCGGQLVQMPCSHVGHVFRMRTPYTESSDSQDAIMRNRMRVAEVWMDDYKHLFYSFVQPKGIDVGDVTDRKLLRDRLQCGSFESYLQRVAPERWFPLSYSAFGMVRATTREEHGLNVCLFANYHKSHDNGGHVPLAAKRCDMYDKYLVFILEAESQKLRIDLNCLYIKANKELELKACSDVTDAWQYEQSQRIRHHSQGACLQIDPSGRHVTAVACSDSMLQRWNWNRD